jgi:predicted AAA+ superfamily ATPase
LENQVFLALRRRTREIYYVTSAAGYEVDFYLPETQELIQVSQHLAHPGTRIYLVG